MSRLMDYLPEWYKNSPEMIALQSSLQAETDLLWAARQDLLQQLDPFHATWALDLWEAALGIPKDETKAAGQRVSIILARLRGRATTTIDMVKSVCDSFLDADFEVEELCDEYLVRVIVVVGLGSAPDTALLADTLREMLPAHLAMEVRVRMQNSEEQYVAQVYSGAAASMTSTISVEGEAPASTQEQE